MKQILISVVLFAFLFSCSKESITPDREVTKHIKGKLLGYDNKPMQLAHVHVYIYGKQKKDLIFQVDEKGTFSIPIKSADFIELEFSGTDHRMAHIELFNFDSHEDLVFNVKLSPNTISDNIDKIEVMGTFNDFSFSEGKIEMTPLQDGMYEAMIPNDRDTVYYQILGSVSGSRSINGTMSHGFVYDGGGDYRSFIVTSDTLIKIFYDSKKLQKEVINSVFETKDESLNSYFTLIGELNSLSDLAIEEFNKTKNVADYHNFYYNGLKKLLKDNDAKRNKMLIMQKLIESAYSSGKEIDKKAIREYLDIIGPNSVYWEKSVSLVIPALELLGDKKYHDEFLNIMIYKNPSDEVRQRILYDLARYYFGRHDKENGIKYYNILVETYPDSRITSIAKKELSPDRSIVVGKKIPAFSFENLDKPGEMITNELFIGKLTLIDIWATWCGPCVGEMEYLHNAYNKYKNKQFEMYSISIDAKKDDIAKFRKGKWKMPWLHSFSGGIWESKVVELFEVRGVPQPMLISPDGTILEIGETLRGEELLKVIEKYLK